VRKGLIQGSICFKLVLGFLGLGPLSKMALRCVSVSVHAMIVFEYVVIVFKIVPDSPRGAIQSNPTAHLDIIPLVVLWSKLEGIAKC